MLGDKDQLVNACYSISYGKNDIHHPNQFNGNMGTPWDYHMLGPPTECTEFNDNHGISEVNYVPHYQYDMSFEQSYPMQSEQPYGMSLCYGNNMQWNHYDTTTQHNIHGVSWNEHYCLPLNQRHFADQQGSTVGFPALQSTEHMARNNGIVYQPNSNEHKQQNQDVSTLQIITDAGNENTSETPCPQLGLQHTTNVEDGSENISVVCNNTKETTDTGGGSSLPENVFVPSNAMPAVVNGHIGNPGIKLSQAPNDLMGHKRNYEVKNQHKCEICLKSYCHSANLRRHRELHCNKPHRCRVCGKLFSLKHNLAQHELLHTGEKPYPCNICGKSFNRKHNLRVHERIHTDERLYECKACGKAFRHSNSLRSHSSIHTGEKPFQCKVCGVCFNQKPHLVRHEMIHTGKKPYRCNVCGKSFNRKYLLTGHERIHTEDKL